MSTLRRLIGAALVLLAFVVAVVAIWCERLAGYMRQKRRAGRSRRRAQQLRRLADEQAREVAERIAEDRRHGG